MTSMGAVKLLDVRPEEGLWGPLAVMDGVAPTVQGGSTSRRSRTQWMRTVSGLRHSEHRAASACSFGAFLTLKFCA